MFIFTETGYQLFRNRGRSILLLCVSALLCGCMAFYLGNITTSQRDLHTLNETSPAVLHVVNSRGTSRRNLTISSLRYDVLCKSEIHGVLATAQADARFGASGQEEKYQGGDTHILGLTCKEAAGFISDSEFAFAEGYDGSIFTGSEALCVVTEKYAGEHDLTVGGSLTLPVYMITYNAYVQPVYVWISDLTMEIAGTVPKTGDSSFQADVYVPVRWLRAQAEQAGIIDFSYATFEAKLNDSMALNDYKEHLTTIGFNHPVDNPSSFEDYENWADGTAILMEDETFIKSAERLVEKLEQFENFQIPFFVVIFLLVTLAIFLVLRGSRKDMAIACSLGRPKFFSGASCLLAAIVAELAGCVAALPVMSLAAGLGMTIALRICGAFLICALAGDVVALIFLLRFDPLQMLIETE